MGETGRDHQAWRAGRPGRCVDPGGRGAGPRATQCTARRGGGGTGARHRARQPARARLRVPGMEVVARLLFPLPRRGRDAPRPGDRAGFALGREPHGRQLPARQLRLHRVERPSREGHARLERAARLVRDPGDLPVREGAEPRLAQARTRPSAVRPAEQEQVIGNAGSWPGVLVAVVAANLTPGPACAQDRITRDQVVAILARASPEHPADFTGQDLSGLDLSGIDFKRANLTKCRLVRTNFAKARLFSATLTDAVATDADFTGANLRLALLNRANLTGADLTDADVTGADLAGAVLKDVRGRDRIRGLDQALHVDQAVFHD